VARLDLNFSRIEADAQVTALPPDLAVLLVGVAARQAVSPTAQEQARLARPVAAPGRFDPAHGAFQDDVAGMLRDARNEEQGKVHGSETPVNPPFTEPL
jgi:hypothetical protein